MTDNKLHYIEDGKMVFTEEFHKLRGYCCGHMCRHCAFEPKHIQGNTNRDPNKAARN